MDLDPERGSFTNSILREGLRAMLHSFFDRLNEKYLSLSMFQEIRFRLQRGVIIQVYFCDCFSHPAHIPTRYTNIMPDDTAG